MARLLWLLLFLVAHVHGTTDIYSFLATQKPENNPFGRNQTNETSSVILDLKLVQLVGINEKVLNADWLVTGNYIYNHPRMKWNPELYHGVEVVYLQKLWTPGISTCNRKKVEDADPELSKMYTVHHTGVVHAKLIMQTTLNCELDFRRLPFDGHFCTICLRVASTPDYDQTFRVNFPSEFQTISDSQFGLSEEILLMYSQQVDGDIILDAAIIGMWATRHSKFYVLLIVAPMITTTLLYMLASFLSENHLALFGYFTGAALFSTIIVIFVSSVFPQQLALPALAWCLAVLWMLTGAVSGAYSLIHMVFKEKKEKEKDDRDIEKGVNAPQTQGSGRGGATDANGNGNPYKRRAMLPPAVDTIAFSLPLQGTASASLPEQKEKEQSRCLRALKCMYRNVRAILRVTLLLISIVLVFVVALWAFLWMGEAPLSVYLHPHPSPDWPHFPNGTRVLHKLKDSVIYIYAPDEDDWPV